VRRDGEEQQPRRAEEQRQGVLDQVSGSRLRRARAPHKAAKTGAARISAAASIDVNHCVGISKPFTWRFTLRSRKSDMVPHS